MSVACYLIVTHVDSVGVHYSVEDFFAGCAAGDLDAEGPVGTHYDVGPEAADFDCVSCGFLV